MLKIRTIGIVPLAVVVLTSPSVLLAQDTTETGYQLDLELGLLHSDNPLGNNPSGPSDSFLVPRAQFDVQRGGSRWQARGSGHMEYRMSMEDVVEDEFRANLAAAVDWTLLPGLEWTFQNVASVEPIDFLGTDSSDNLQQTNVLMTGPVWQIRPMSVWGGVVDARYTHSHAEESKAFDSDRFSASGRLLRRFDANRQASVGAEVTDVQFRDAEFADADHQRLDLLARYGTRAALTELELAVGHTWIDPDQGANISALLARMQLTWNRDGIHSLHLLAQHELSDTTRQLTSEIDRIGRHFAGDSRLPIGAGIYRLSSIEPGWRYRYPRGELSVRPFYRDFDFEFTPDVDFDEFGVALRGSLRIRPRTTLLASIGADRRRFELDQRRDTDLLSTLFLAHRFAPRWSGRVGAVRFQRDSNIPAADSRELVVSAYLTFHAGR